MKLLICTQKVDKNDPVLGFFHRWLEEFAKHAEHVHVVALGVGEHTLPQNVTVYSLGKEVGRGNKLIFSFRFIRLIFSLRKEYDSVFVHMNPEYVVLGGLFWRALKKKVTLWYAHKSVTKLLALAPYFVEVIFTPSAQSLRLKTLKKKIMGHGIDTSFFLPQNAPLGPSVRCITVSRLSPVKQVDLIIRALSRLPSQVTLTVVGSGSLEYEEALREIGKEIGVSERISWLGALPQEKMREQLKDHHLFLHASETGSMDKAPLEALATGMPVVTTNIELCRATPGATIFSVADPSLYALEAQNVIDKALWNMPEVRESARSFIMENHNLTHLVQRIANYLSSAQ